MSWETGLKVEVMKNSLVKFRVEVLQVYPASEAWWAGIDKDETDPLEMFKLRESFGERFIEAISDELSIHDLEMIVEAADRRIKEFNQSLKPLYPL